MSSANDKPKHSPLGASSAARWIGCPGSVQLIKKLGLQGRRTSWAAVGNAAHEVAEVALVSGKYLPAGHLITVPDFPEKIPVDQDMLDAVRVYVDVISFINSLDPLISIVEEPFQLSSDEWLYGKNDYGAYIASIDTMVCVDYKHGAGVFVDVSMNSQLLYYACGLMERVYRDTGRVPGTIVLMIVQPRAPSAHGPVRTFALSSADLMRWHNDTLLPAVHRTRAPNPPLKTGKYCQFCPAAGQCDELHKQAATAAQLEFQPHASTMPPAKIAALLDQAELISVWAKAVAKVAHDRMDAGSQIPGYKLVQGRAKREWADPNRDPGDVAEIMGLDRDDGYEISPRSPAAMEDMIGRRGDRPAILAAIEERVRRAPGGTTVVRETDPRDTVRPPKGSEFIGR